MNKSVSSLRRFEKQSDSALKTHARLRKELARPVSTAGLSRYDARVKSVGANVRALNRDASKLNTTLGKKAAGPQGRAGRGAADDHVRAFRTMERERTRGERENLRLLREGLRLKQDAARLSAIERRSSSAAGVADIRLARERIRLRREQERALGARARGAGFGYQNGLGGRAQSAVAAGQAFRAAADTAVEFARPAMEQMRAEARFRVMGYPAADNARGMAAVDSTVQTVRGVKRADVVETLTALTSTFGEIEQATKFLPIASRYRANMQTLQGDQISPADINRQISNTFKSLELLGVDRPTGPGGAFTDQDRARMEGYFNMIAQATAATGGDINPAEFRAFTKYGRTSVMGLSPQGLQKLLPLIQQLGGAQTGTALMSLNQNLVGGAMPAYKLREWDRLGLLDRSKVEVSKAGLVKRMQPGAIPMAGMLQTDPVAFADKLSETLRAKGVDTQDFNQVNKQISALLGNRTSAGALSQLINYRASLDKEAKNYERALSVDETHRTLFGQQNPLANFLDLQAKWNDAKAREAMGLVGRAGGAAGAASGFMAEHPDAASALTGVISLGKASTEAAGGVGLLRDALGGLRGGGGGGGIFGSGVDLGDIAGGGWALGQMRKRLGMGAAGLLPRLGPAGLIAGLAGGSAYALHSDYRRNTAAREGARTGADDIHREAVAVKARSGGVLPREESERLLKQVMPHGPTALLISLTPKTYGGAGYPGMSAARPHEQEQIVGEFKRQAKALEVPEVMSAFMRQTRQLVGEGKMTGAAGDRSMQIAQQAFPESFKQATEGVGLLAQGSQAAAESLENQSRASDRVAPSLFRLTGALDSAASRLAGLRFELPALPAAPGAPFPGPGRPFGSPGVGGFNFNLPGSAAGSVVHRDGVAALHRGNVITPAKLSRRRPGDWLDAAPSLAAGADSTPAGEGADFGGILYSPRYEFSVGTAADIDAAINRIEAQQAEERARLRAEMLAVINSPRRLRRQMGEAETRRREVA